MEGKQVLIIAGPNGAGKTTFAREYLTHEGNCPLFVNADLIASGISPFAPEDAAVAAARIMLQRMDDLAQRGESFAFETTLAGISYQHRIREWRDQGYTVILIFLRLPNVEEALDRVAGRVRQGGHSVPEATIRRRFTSGLRNFQHLYKPIVHAWMLYDNSGSEPVLIEWGKNK